MKLGPGLLLVSLRCVWLRPWALLGGDSSAGHAGPKARGLWPARNLGSTWRHLFLITWSRNKLALMKSSCFQSESKRPKGSGHEEFGERLHGSSRACLRLRAQLFPLRRGAKVPQPKTGLHGIACDTKKGAAWADITRPSKVVD